MINTRITDRTSLTRLARALRGYGDIGACQLALDLVGADWHIGHELQLAADGEAATRRDLDRLIAAAPYNPEYGPFGDYFPAPTPEISAAEAEWRAAYRRRIETQDAVIAIAVEVEAMAESPS